MYRFTYIPSLLLLVCALLVPQAATHAASEIHYGALKAQHGETLLLRYNGPSGEQFFTCDTKGDCKNRGNEEPFLLPKALKDYTYTLSQDGSLLVLTVPWGKRTLYALYQMEPKRKAIGWLPYMEPGATIYIAKNNNAIVFRQGSRFTRYDLEDNKTQEVTLAQNLSFLSLSPNASYVTGYNYSTLRHELWRFADGKKIDSPSSMQSYLEFAEDESRLAFLEDVDGFKTLFTMKSGDLGKANPASLTQLTEPNTETEDYLYAGDTLYFIANADGPLEWDLFSYDGSNTSLVDADISYGDYLKRVRTGGDSYLAYLKTTGKNTNIRLIRENMDTPREIAPVNPSETSTKIDREVKEYGERIGVLLSPEDPARRPALFIWMHGGPQRQVAKGYHPYLSYAVYDEMLERLVEGGHYVYKIDYTGSTGYGTAFRKALHMKIGTVEIADVENAIDDIQDDIDDIDDVYLIGNSYGGYMALKGIVEMPRELDGAISINGVADWYSLINRIPSSPFKALFEGIPDTTNLDAYLQASVYTGMEDLNSRDKVLVVWGEQDATVPTWQSKDYVEYATEQGLNLKTLSFEDETHLIMKRKNLDTLCSTITDFMGVRGVSCQL